MVVGLTTRNFIELFCFGPGLSCPVSYGMICSQAENDEVEKRIASLPPGQRVYERFRFWKTVPPDQQRDRTW